MDGWSWTNHVSDLEGTLDLEQRFVKAFNDIKPSPRENKTLDKLLF